MNVLKLSALSVCVAFAAVAATPEVVTQEASGQAPIFGKDGEAKAFEDAKQQALRNAVEQAAGVLVTSDTVTRNSMLVVDQVYAKAQGYVKKYDVVEKKVERNTVVVKVKAEVIATQLEKDLAAVQSMIKQLGRNKLIIVLQEQAIDNKGVAAKSEQLASVLTETFKKDGWLIIDEKGTGSADGAMKVSSGVGQGMLDAKEIAKKSDADYIVYGAVNFRYTPPSNGGMIPEVDKDGNQVLFFVTGEYDLTMFETRTGRQLAKVAGKFDQQKMMKARIAASKSYEQTARDFCLAEAPRIVGELRTPVVEYLRDKAVNGNDVVVAVSGLPDLDAVEELEKSMGALDKVTKVTTGDFQGGKVEFTVAYGGTAKELGSALKSKSVKKKKIQVVGLMNNKVEIALSK